MSKLSTIEWTNSTWNPITGCSKVSLGCKHCYAERLANRLHAMKQRRYQNGFSVTMHWDLLKEPLLWKKPQMIFVNSMSDLFHEQVEEKFIKAVFSTIEKAHWHTFQILTKRTKRLRDLAYRLYWPENLWMGVSIENEKYLYRIQDLLMTPAAIKFLSVEPLLGRIKNLPVKGIDWVIVGGESGPLARSMDLAWVREIRDSCKANGLPFFFKQWGGTRKTPDTRLLDGKIWNEYPAIKVGRSADNIFYSISAP
jgi:protein gp37